MATIVTWSGDGLAPGTLTTASAGTGDTAPTAVLGTVKPTIESAGTRAPRIRAMANPLNDQSAAYWQFTSQAQGGGRVYFDTPTEVPPSGQAMDILVIQNTTARVISVDITNSARFNLRDNTNVIAQTASGSLALGHRYRLEWQINHGTGAVALRIFNGEETTHVAQLAGTSANLGATHNRVIIGKINTSQITVPCSFDDLLVTDTAEYPGPWVAASTYESGMTIWDGAVERAVSAWLWDGSAAHLLGNATTTPHDPAFHPTFGLPTFRDEFDGSVVDPAKWSVKDAPWFGNTPDRAVIRSDHATIDNGELRLRATWRDTPSGSPARWHDTGYIDHRSGGTPPGTSSSSTIYSQQYGRWEVCATTPTGPNTLGTLAAFWLRCNSTPGEIDIMEAWGYAGMTPTSNGQFPGSSTLTFHSSTTSSTVNGKPYTKTLGRVNQRLGDYSSSNWSYMSNNLPLHPAFDGYHVWGFEYMPGYIRADYDGQEYFYVTPSTPDPEDSGRTCAWLWDPDFFGSPFHMRCNLHVGMSEAYWGVPNPDNRTITSDPLDFRVRYIRAWRFEV